MSCFFKPFTQGDASPHGQLRFLEQLLTLAPGRKQSSEWLLLSELHTAENLPHLTPMLEPTFDPWPAHIKYIFCL